MFSVCPYYHFDIKSRLSKCLFTIEVKNYRIITNYLQITKFWIIGKTSSELFKWGFHKLTDLLLTRLIISLLGFATIGCIKRRTTFKHKRTNVLVCYCSLLDAIGSRSLLVPLGPGLRIWESLEAQNPNTKWPISIKETPFGNFPLITSCLE